MINLQCRVKTLLENACKAKIFPGCAAGIITPQSSEIVTCGFFTYENELSPVTPQSVFDVASITKAIPVSCCALKLIEQKKLSINDRLISYLPSFSGSYRDEITIAHLLAHTLDFDLRLSTCKNLSADELMELILAVKLKCHPGERFCYANATSILLGLVLEAFTGKTINCLGDEHFFKPLGMSRTGFDISRIAIDEIIPTEIDDWRGGVVRGQVHDESAWKFRPRAVGSAGLFSTITDMVTFVDALLQSFSDSPKAIFSSEFVKLIITNQRPPESGEWAGLGWELNQESFMGKYRTHKTFGKTGFTGCSIVADPVSMRAVVLLSNHVYPKRRANRDDINNVRKALADIVLER